MERNEIRHGQYYASIRRNRDGVLKVSEMSSPTIVGMDDAWDILEDYKIFCTKVQAALQDSDELAYEPANPLELETETPAQAAARELAYDDVPDGYIIFSEVAEMLSVKYQQVHYRAIKQGKLRFHGGKFLSAHADDVYAWMSEVGK